MPRQPRKIKRNQLISVPVDFLSGQTHLHIEITCDGWIRLREPYARRWLEYPLARLYVQACDAASHVRP